jgi:hypothetical protein
MNQLVRQPVEVTIDEQDLLTPTEAAELSGRALTTILGLMAFDKLPIYELQQDRRKRPQRYTSRKAVKQLAKRRDSKAKAG